MYDPATRKPFPNASAVTVSQTTNLVNQMLHVSWTDLTPGSSLVYDTANVYYPVMVTECKGTNPASPADCYGTEDGGVNTTGAAFGPTNDADASTGPNGTGSTDTDTGEQNTFLGGHRTRPGSLAIVPAQLHPHRGLLTGGS
jgi:hypothetical protein